METPRDLPDIRSGTQECLDLFNKFFTKVRQEQIERFLSESVDYFYNVIISYRYLFRIRSSLMSIFDEEKICLDHYLSNNKDTQAKVKNELRTIALNLQSLFQMIIAGNDGNQNVASMEKDELYPGSNFPTSVRVALDSVRQAVEKLDRLSRELREATEASLISRINDFSSKKASGSHLEKMTFLIVQSLYPTAPLKVQHLLSCTMLERHSNMQCQGERQQRLAPQKSSKLDEEDQLQVNNDGPELIKPITPKDCIDGVPVVPCHDSVTGIDTKHSQSGSKPPTIQEDEALQLIYSTEIRNMNLSKLSWAPIGDICYPKPPKLSEGDLSMPKTCHWCSKSYPQDLFHNEQWWRRHVERDLRPYICLFDNCPASLNPFDDFITWKEHMDDHHPLYWIQDIYATYKWGCFPSMEHRPPEVFDDEASLRDHMIEQHQDRWTKSQIMNFDLKLQCRFREFDCDPEVCPLCEFDPSKPIIADLPGDLQRSLRGTKRKQQPGHNTQSKSNEAVQKNRRQTDFPDWREIIESEPISSSESDSESASSQSSLSSSLKSKVRWLRTPWRRGELTRHIATHLEAISFLSLRLKNFQCQPEEEDQDCNTGDEWDTFTSEEGDPAGCDSEFDEMPRSSKKSASEIEDAVNIWMDGLRKRRGCLLHGLDI